MKEEINQIRALISNARIESALAIFPKIIKEGKLPNEYLLLCNRYAALKSALISNTQNPEVSIRERNLISKSLLELVDIMEEGRGFYDNFHLSGLKILGCQVVEKKHQINEFKRYWLEEHFDQGLLKGTFPIIDMKFYNSSERPIFIHKLIINSQIIEKVVDLKLAMPLKASWAYSVCLNPNMRTETCEVNLSQVIQPNDVDRFFIIIGHCGTNLKSVLFELELLFLYNENDRLKCQPIQINVRGPELLDIYHNSGIIQVDLKGK